MNRLSIDKQLELIWDIRYSKTSDAFEIASETLQESKAIGYKKGTYGSPMKGVMKGQVARYSDADLAATGLGK